jgi:hypothetical protein
MQHIGRDIHKFYGKRGIQKPKISSFKLEYSECGIGERRIRCKISLAHEPRIGSQNSMETGIQRKGMVEIDFAQKVLAI